MSKQLVARALRELAIDNEESTPIQRAIDDSTAALIRAVDAQYPEGYDENGGFIAHDFGGYLFCSDCLGRSAYDGHRPDCHRWNTRVALLNLCRDILGEQE